MPAPRKWIAGLKFILSVCLLAVSANAFVFSQTSVNDVHVTPRALAPASTPKPGSAVKDTMLHVIKSDVKLVLQPKREAEVALAH